MNNTPTLAQSATITPVVAGSTGANLIREAAAVMVDAHALASAVANTQMIPKHFQGKPDECAAAMLYGASLGLDPMQSVRQIYVVHGQAALYARAMSALVQGAGHKVWTVESTDQSVTVSGSRRGAEHVETSTWTFDRAQRAGYTNNSKYKSDPQAMLYSKALSEVCRKIAPDVLSGIYTVEELTLEGADETAAPKPTKPRGLAAVRAAVKAPQPAPEPVEVERPTPDDAGPMTERTRGQLFALFTERNITDRDEQIRGIVHITGRPIESRSELTEDEGRQVIAVLKGQA